MSETSPNPQPEPTPKPAEIESPLGRDDIPSAQETIRILAPDEEGTDEGVELPDEPKSEAPEPEAPKEDWKAKYDELAQQHEDMAKAVRMIEGEPELAQHILDYFARKHGGEQPEPSISDSENSNGSKETALARQVQQLQATIAVMEFRTRVPDFEQVREKMAAEINRNPNLTLDDAYQLAKAKSGQPSANKPEIQPAESRGSVSSRATSPGSADIEAKIAGARDFDEAIRVAFEAAAQGKRS